MMEKYIIHRGDELYHFGVKGMHWGIRRYQNEDGSYKSGAEGRYAPDGKPGPNTGHTVKNRVKSALGVYKEGDGNPYVSEKRRKIRKTEKESYEEAERKAAEKKANKKKTESELEDEEISRRADALQKKNPKMSRRDAESAAEDDMIAEARAKRKAEGKESIFDRLGEKIEKSASEREERKASKKTASEDDDDKWTHEDLDKYFGKGYFDFPSTKWKRSHNRAKHSQSGYSDDYDLYHHGILGMHWGIRRYQNEDGTLTAAGKERYNTDSGFRKKINKKTKIENINKKQANNYNYTSDVRNAVNKSYKNAIGAGMQTVSDEITSRFVGTKAKGIYGTGQTATHFAINYLKNIALSQIKQSNALKRYNDDGTKRIKEGSPEDKKLKRRERLIEYGVEATGAVLKVLAGVGIRQIERAVSMGARQPYDINGHWKK